MDEYGYLTIEFDDGESDECEILGTFNYEDQEYIALLPVRDVIDDVDDVYLFGYEVVDEHNFNLVDINDDELFEKVSQEFYKMAEEYLL